MKKFLLFFCFLVFLGFCFLSLHSPALANNNNDVDCWTDCRQNIGGDEYAATIQCIECIFEKFFMYATTFAGLAVFIMFLVGGFQYLTSMGDPKGTESARNTLTYAVLGLILVIAAWFILQFIEEFTGVTVTKFEIPE